MTTSKPMEKTHAGLNERLVVTQVERRALFGLVRWWVVLKKESLGKDLIIETAEKYDRIIVNGKEIS